MPIGAGTFTPSGRFTVIRSYIAQFNLLVNSPVTQDDNVFTFPDAGTPGRNYTVKIKGEFYNWSSNRYTLDFIMEDAYYTDPPFFVPVPITYGLVNDYGTYPGLPTLSFLPFALPFTDAHVFRLDQLQPGSYWRPHFPE